MRLVNLSLVAGAALALATAANAGVYAFNMQVEWNGVVWDTDDYPDAYQVIPGSTPGQATIIGEWVQAEWGITFTLDFDDSDSDGSRSGAPRLVTSNIVVTNTTAAAQDFMVTTILPVPAKGPATLIRGFNSGSVGDNSLSQNGATLTTNTIGSPLYEALMDGVAVRSLRDAFQSFSAPGGGTGVIPTTSFGSPVFEFGGAVNASIGIRNRFNLTPDDSTTMNSTFLVAVPTPGAIALIGVAGLAGLRRRR